MFSIRREMLVSIVIPREVHGEYARSHLVRDYRIFFVEADIISRLLLAPIIRKRQASG